MFNLSIKQLFRQPGKVVLFFLLMAASTALVVLGLTLTVENNRRIQILEDTYSTIGFVSQMPVTTENTYVPNPCYGSNTVQEPVYGDYILPEDLLFPGADYVQPPEQRPYYVYYNPDFKAVNGLVNADFHIVEFTPVESGGEDGGPLEVEVTKILFTADKFTNMAAAEGDAHSLQAGEHITVCQCWDFTHYPMEAGEKYVAHLYYDLPCDEHGIFEYKVYTRPHSNQVDRVGSYIDKGNFPSDIDWDYYSPTYPEIAHVTGEDFYEKGNSGYRFVQWAKQVENISGYFTALPTNSLELLPSWHNGNIALQMGREITQEEFDSGAMVCMVPKEFADKNLLRVGDKVKLPFMCSVYADLNIFAGGLSWGISLLDADCEFYEPFFEGEYEIVGLVDVVPRYDVEAGRDVFIIPAKSVTASDEGHMVYGGHMSSNTTSFQIPNGSIEKFNTVLHATLGTSIDDLTITYDDRGYSEIRKSLDNSRKMAFLLLLGGVMAALSIVALLLYFFVAKEKKRTAIERSLGMTKRQCRVSLLAGLMILTVVATGVGSIGGMLSLDKVREPQAVAETAEERDSQYIYDTSYSPWAASRDLAEKAEITVETPMYVSYVTPVCLNLLVLALALIVMANSFRIDPIYLLSTREKE